MKFEIADIVRFKNQEMHGFGLHEITDLNTPKGEGYEDIDCTVTKDECNSEFYARQEDLVLVCSVKDRQDIVLKLQSGK